MLRFVFLFNYANGVSLDDGEAWYHGPHVQDLKAIPGVQCYRSWRALKVPENISRVMTPPEDDYVRRSEVWFDSYEAWEASRECWVASQDGAPGFRGFDAIFVANEPQYDLLRDVPPEHYKYIAWPIQWRGGVPPEIEDGGDTVLYSYFVRRPSHVSTAEADDWYLGHHTREGKQMPSLKHYKTWSTISVPEQPRHGLIQPDHWYRLTELGMSFSNFYTTMLDPKVGVFFTPNADPGPPPSGGPPGRGNIFIKLDEAEQLI